LDSEALKPLVQDPLGLVLAQREQERVWRVERVEAHLRRAASPAVNGDAIDPVTQLDKLLGDAKRRKTSSVRA
jgi:hypothetical protein